jgi:hypothetical protein
MAWNNNNNNNKNNYNYGNQKSNNVEGKFGAKIRTTKSGGTCLTAWRYAKSTGLITLVASPNSDGEVFKNKKGESYTRWTGKLTNKRTLAITTVSVLHNNNTNKFYITDLNLMASPNGGKGKGYFGFISKK